MDITKAKKVVELSKDNRTILVTLWDGDKISSCVTEEPPSVPPPENGSEILQAPKQYCESCQGDEALCNEFVEHLKAQGYQATEVHLGELGIEESLPRFLEERKVVIPGETTGEPTIEVVPPEGEVEPVEEET